MLPGGLDIALDHAPGRTRVVVSGELDLATVPQLTEAVEGATPPGGTVEVDLRDVEFMDSAGVAAINRCRRGTQELEADLVLLVREGGPVAQLVEWTGLNTILDVRTTA
jgi:anti-anti-sigma factor